MKRCLIVLLSVFQMSLLGIAQADELQNLAKRLSRPQPPTELPPGHDPLQGELERPAYQRIFIPLTELDLARRAEPSETTTDRPADRSQDIFSDGGLDYPRGARRPWAVAQTTWSAPEYWHYPLYFEDAPLERYGQSHFPLLQPAVSAFHFYGGIFAWPYRAGLAAPTEYVPNLGYARSGSPTPCLRETLPLSLRGALYETAAVMYFIYVLP